MKFMVVERFPVGKVDEIYRVLRTRGRQMPEGLSYLESWISADLETCFQLMECDDAAALQKWVAQWSGLLSVTFYPVTSSKETSAIMASLSE